MTPAVPDPAPTHALPSPGRRTFLALAALSIIAPLARAFETPLLPRGPDVNPSTFAIPNGPELHYETHGSGAPLVLLHGGVMPDCFGANVATLAKGRQAITVHLQGHGHTRDIDRPLRFESMADDVAQLIDHLGLGTADVLGYSLGGGVALQMAIRHPRSVRRLVVVSQPMRHAAWFPEVQDAYRQMSANATQVAQNIRHSPMAAMYPAVEWERLLRKIGDLESTDFDWKQEVSRIEAATMLVFADADAIHVDHMAEFYRALGGAQRDAGLDGSLRSRARLAVLPDTTHYAIAANPTMADVVSRFIDAED